MCNQLISSFNYLIPDMCLIDKKASCWPDLPSHRHKLKSTRYKIHTYRVYRDYQILWFASEKYLILSLTKDWCLIFFVNMGDLLFEQKLWLKLNFMVLYGIPMSNQEFWEFSIIYQNIIPLTLIRSPGAFSV